MSSVQILVVEDESDIVELLKFNLEREGYRVESALTGELGLTMARKLLPDLILLDIMLPERGGMDVCRELKADKYTRAIPVIMMTARSEEADIVSGLEVGADDYITKPFSPRVLVARVRAALRRQEVNAEEGDAFIKAGDITIDAGRHEVKAAGIRIDLTPTEFQLLTVLARRPGWVFSRNQLMDEVRGGEVITTDRAVDVQVVGLRKKLGDYGTYIETVRGVGYKYREI